MAGQIGAAVDEAGRAQAHRAAMGRGGLQAKQVVKAGHTPHPAQGETEGPGHLIEDGRRQKAMKLLHLMQHFDQGVSPTAVTAHDLVDALAVLQGGRPMGLGGP